MRKYSRSRWFAFFITLAMLFSVFGPIAPVQANGNNALNQSARFDLNGDVVAAGAGLRGIGTGDIALSGIPSGASVIKAFLYWATIGTANTYTSPTLEGTSVDGELIGTSGDTCWGAQHNFVYRADVTDLVSGNGTFTIAGLPASLENGNDSQGASLVVVFEDAAEPMRTIIINDGAVTLDFDQNTYTDEIQGYSADDPVTDAHITYLVGDGQSSWDSGNVLFEGESIAQNVFTGVDGDFWGTLTFDVTSLVGITPATTTIDNEDPDNPDSPDCLLWAGTVFSVTSSTAVEDQNILSQSFQYSLHGDVTASGVGLRGAGEGDIVVTGIPAGAYINKAFLYWATIGSSGTFDTPTLNGQSVNGELIGISPDTCWGAQHNFVYRAEVDGLVTGNGTYTIAGLPDDLQSGDDSQGASLVIVYLTSFNDRFRTVTIDDGAVTLDLDDHEYTDTLEGFAVSDPVIESHVTYLVGDGQAIWDSGNVLFEGTSIAQNVFTGVDGDYWGTLTFDVTSLVDGSPAETTLNNNDPDNPDSPDCLLWAATIFSVTPPQPSYDTILYLPIVIHNSP
jgi:hypothetical protein